MKYELVETFKLTRAFCVDFEAESEADAMKKLRSGETNELIKEDANCIHPDNDRIDWALFHDGVCVRRGIGEKYEHQTYPTTDEEK